VGKSSLVNSLLGEKAAAVSAFKLQADTESSTVFSRQVAAASSSALEGFKLRLIDTCGLEDPEAGDTINYVVGAHGRPAAQQPGPGGWPCRTGKARPRVLFTGASMTWGEGADLRAGRRGGGGGGPGGWVSAVRGVRPGRGGRVCRPSSLLLPLLDAVVCAVMVGMSAAGRLQLAGAGVLERCALVGLGRQPGCVVGPGGCAAVLLAAAHGAGLHGGLRGPGIGR